MIQYTVDNKSIDIVNGRIRDMNTVLQEVATTYQMLLEIVEEQEKALSSVSINMFRKELKTMLQQAIGLSEEIADYSQKLVVVSDQAIKHLSAFDERFAAVLQKHTHKVEE